MSKNLDILSFFPSLNKKAIIWTYLAIGWLLITLIAMTAADVVSYDDVKYFFWIFPPLLPLMYLLYVNGMPTQLSKKEERRTILVLAFTFTCLVVTFFAAIFYKEYLT